MGIEESSGPETSERNLESEDDASQKPPTTVNEDHDSSGTLTQAPEAEKTVVEQQHSPECFTPAEGDTLQTTEQATVICEDEKDETTTTSKTIEDNTEDDSAV